MLDCCYKQIIEPLISKQWFVTMEPLAENALKVVEKGELTIMPERFEKVYKFIIFFCFIGFDYLIMTSFCIYNSVLYLCF